MDENNNNNKVPPTPFMGAPVTMQQQQQQPQQQMPYPPQQQQMYSPDPYAQQQQMPYPPPPSPQSYSLPPQQQQQPDPYAQQMTSPYPSQQPQQLPYPPQPYPDPYTQAGAPYPPQAFIQPPTYPPQPDVYGQYPQASYDLGGPHEKHHHYSKEETMHAILCRDYHVTIKEWVSQAWGIYKSCWWGYSVTFLLYVLLSMIPYIGFAVMLLGYVLYAGWFIAATNSMKSGQPVRVSDFVHGFGFGLWIFGQSILITLAVALGLVLFIVPGLILAVILSFSWFVLIEYKRNGIELIDAMILSAKVCWKKFWWILLFNIAMFFLAISGVLALGVGLLVTVPLAYIAHATAFRDIFGLNMNSEGAAWQQV